jgi:hypothetical protein
MQQQVRVHVGAVILKCLFIIGGFRKRSYDYIDLLNCFDILYLKLQCNGIVETIKFNVCS